MQDDCDMSYDAYLDVLTSQVLSGKRKIVPERESDRRVIEFICTPLSLPGESGFKKAMKRLKLNYYLFMHDIQESAPGLYKTLTKIGLPNLNKKY